MCLIFLSINNHPAYKLVIAGNRDEFYERKTAPAEFWKDQPHILAGRDLEAMGTWLGVTRSGRVSLLTNFRDPRNINPKAPSRGKLVSDFLTSDASAKAYINEISNKGRIYNGFNLIAGTVDELWYCSNYSEEVKRLSTGEFGLSNHLLDTPWPKLTRGKKRFGLLLQKRELKSEVLFEFLYDDRQAPDDQLPDTGVGLERERVLSSMFIKSPNYGSRCSTVVLVDRNNRVLFAERIYDLKSFAYTTKVFEFTIGK